MSLADGIAWERDFGMNQSKTIKLNNKNMEKIKLTQTVRRGDKNIPYEHILKTVKKLKSKIESDLREVGLEDEFEIIVTVDNSVESIVIHLD